MAKKKNPRQLREEAAAARKQKYQQAAEKRQQLPEEQAQKETAEAVSSQPTGAHLKSYAKASGLKSVFVVGNAAVMTSFGRGNEALLEHQIEPDRSVKSLAAVNTLSQVSLPKGDQIHFRGQISNGDAVADNPLYQKPSSGGTAPKPMGEDLLCLKEKLETHFFGKTFNDNIHIQMIYKIMDIYKTLALYSNNIVFVFDNVLRKKEEELKGDFFGNGDMRSSRSFEEFKIRFEGAEKDVYSEFQSFVNKKELLYFGDTFYSNGKPRSEETIYNILALLSSLRQSCFHSDLQSENDYIRTEWIFQLDEKLSDAFKETLNTLYSEATATVDVDFVGKNHVNLHILCNTLQAAPEEIVPLYYDFIVRKKQKNLGFSIKKLRECMLEQERLACFKEDRFNTVRSKLYKLFDFIIWYDCEKRELGWKKQLVDSLRACMTEEEKERCYINAAKEMTARLRDAFEEAGENVNGEQLRYLKNQPVYAVKLKECVSMYPVSYFSKMIYLMTKVLDGKEINDLLTTLINAFENIVGFQKTMKELNLDAQFVESYAFFNSCSTISEELRMINSFARMQKPSEAAKYVMYRDALRILGLEEEMDDDALYEEVRRILQIGADGKPIKGADKGFRNFIASNVIESSRFRYLVRYNNAHKTRMLANNKHVVKFVLSEIPDTQLDRYYQLCRAPGQPGMATKEVQLELLTSILTSINYKIFEDVPQSAKIDRDVRENNTGDALIKQRYQAIVSLYLTVMYLVTKNLVYVNSRYVMAFYALERDAYFYDVDLKKKNKKDYRELTKKLLTDSEYTRHGYLKNPKWQELVKNNYTNSDKQSANTFRNMAAHLSVIRNVNLYIEDIREFHSYFELYHYIMQRLLQRSNPDVKEGKTQEYYALVERYRTYCKDFVKAYCIPFGYVTPRYKNLTIDALFDRNRPPTEEQLKEIR